MLLDREVRISTSCFVHCSDKSSFRNCGSQFEHTARHGGETMVQVCEVLARKERQVDSCAFSFLLRLGPQSMK